MMKSSANAAYAGLFISGIASAATAPYLSTLGLEVLGLSGTQYSIIVFVSGILAVVLSLWVGWLSDRISTRRQLISILAAVAGLGIGAFAAFGSITLFVLCCLLFLPLTSILTQQFFAYLRAESRHLDKLAIENRNARGRTVFASAWVATPLIFLITPGFDPASLAFSVSAVACIGGAILFSPLLGSGKENAFSSPAVPPPADNSTWRGVAGACLALTIPMLACGALRAAPRLQQILLGPIVTQEFGGAFSEIGFLSGLTALMELPLILAWGYALRFISRSAMLLVGSLLFSLYFATLYLAPDMLAIYASAFALALATSGTLSITISYLKNLLPERPGLGSSLISVANCLGAAIAALTFAPFADTGAFRDRAIVAGIVVATGGVAIWGWEKFNRGARAPIVDAGRK